ncbi:signal peptidase II [Neomegalonema sp.]|uniref:signal peptidase II n=1 Tax=Neomegalonema sp. TaxID=2039713 RepID=UPI00261E58A9|nr:signal peptidase II [Neomegalonema sp.]MDD2869360.1 signal peptidase II [Neomegalonema sp.]
MSLARAGSVALAVFALDQASKWWVFERLDLRTLGVIEVLPPWLSFHLAWNPGINFGLFASDAPWTKWLLACLAGLVSLGVLVWAGRRAGDGLFALGAGLLAGGALGNALDRMLHGAVADFLNVSCCGIRNPFAFNVADVTIFFGALLVAWRSGSPTSS